MKLEKTQKPLLKVALIHDWLTGMRGGESVLEAIAECFPNADLFTLLSRPNKISPLLNSLKQYTSWINKMPWVERYYRFFLPLMPWTIERFNLSSYDLIISSSHCVAKGIKKPRGAVHISYVHAPMRYFWDRFDDYFGKGRTALPLRFVAQVLKQYFRQWDRSVSTKQRVDLFIANSYFIADQIQCAYGRTSKVIYPFVDLNRFHAPKKTADHFLIVSAFAPNKRIDLAIEAFNRLKLPLLIVGSGQEEASLKKIAGPTVQMLGWRSNEYIAELYSTARAFIFPGVEDFGITPLEAMAAGTPVIAYGKGGATETITDKTGILFSPQTVESLMEAVLKIQQNKIKFQESACRAQATLFTRTRFQNEFKTAVKDAWKQAGKTEE